jgi:Zn ribbon nucleic-acid-binding protein
MMPDSHARPVGTNGKTLIHPPAGRCPHCSAQEERPMVATPQVSYYSCSSCGQVWSIDKPVVAPENH